MPMYDTQNRQTFIALRARREGFQIASEIVNPPLELVRPILRHPDEDYKNEIRRLRRIKWGELCDQLEARRKLMGWIVIGATFTIVISLLVALYLAATGTVD